MGRKDRFKKYRLGYMGSANKNVPINFEMLESDAWKALTPLQCLVLIDWYQNYVRLSRWDYEPLAEGMSYTWAHCKVDMSENAFQTAVKRILEIGFFVRAVQFEAGRPGSPRKFLPSKKWQEHRLDREQQAKQKASSDSKKGRLAEKRKRRKAFRSSLSGKKEPPTKAPTRPPMNAPIRDQSTPNECADTCPNSGDLDPQSVRRSYNDPYGSIGSSVPSIASANSAQDLVDELALRYREDNHPPNSMVFGWIEAIGLARCKTMLIPVVQNGHSAEKVYGLLEKMAKGD